MLYSTVTAPKKRRALRERLSSGSLLRMPGAFNPLSAKLIERKGFDGVYVSGAVLSADLGLPDIGLTTLSEVAGRSAQIARATSLPVLADADTGFGEPINVARTVQDLEDAGVAGLHIEDQVNPKRCGHLDGKQVVDVEDACAGSERRPRPSAIPTSSSWPAPTCAPWRAWMPPIDRARRFVDAGADAVFPEALTSLAEYEASAARSTCRCSPT